MYCFSLMRLAFIFCFTLDLVVYFVDMREKGGLYRKKEEREIGR